MDEEKKYVVAIKKKQAKTVKLTKQQYIGTIFRYLNSLNWNDTLINAVIEAVKSGHTEILPSLMGEYGKYIKIRGSDIWFVIPEFEKEWLVIEEKDKDKILLQLYQDPLTTANSRDGLYSHVMQKYIGISKSYVHSWLKNQESYQLHVKVPQPKNLNVVITRRPGKLWFIDITYLRRFKQGKFQYIMTCVDHFSKYAWTTPLKSMTAMETATALSNILDGKNGIGKKPPAPETIQTDNGNEFSAEFEKVLKSYNIKHTRGYAYAPQSQGTVESFNKTLKRKLVGYMTAIDTERWVEYLPKITENYNNTRHSMTRQTPSDVFWGKTEVAENEKIVSGLVKRRHDNNVKAHASASNNGPVLNVGDYVRLSKFSWNPDRDPKGEENFVKARKSGIATKKYYAGWTRAVFVVKRRLGKEADLKNGIFGTIKYVLADPNKLDENGRPTTLEGRKFYRTDLLKVDIQQTKDIAGLKLDIKKYTLEDMNKYVEEEMEENKKTRKSKNTIVGETRPVDTSKPFWQHQHIVGMHVWSSDKYIGVVLNIANKKNAKGKAVKTAVIRKEDNTFHKYAINTLINRKTKGIVLTNTRNLTDVYEGPVTLKING